MSQSQFPAGRDEEKVRRVPAHYEQQSEEAALEEEAGVEPSKTVSAADEAIDRRHARARVETAPIRHNGSTGRRENPKAS
jgi:hypothetical protein